MYSIMRSTAILTFQRTYQILTKARYQHLHIRKQAPQQGNSNTSISAG